jgi:uncharacterized SAM-binding protein YcdF (DUF218 family)
VLFGHKRRQALVVLLLGTSASGLWLAWPWIVPLVRPVSTSAFGSDVVVVLDGGSGRFAAADRIGHALPQPPHHLLIRCPRGTPPPQPTPELLQGFDTATQITALAHWLRHQPSHRSARVWIATDPDHTARAVILARIALGSQGIRVGPADLPTPSPSEHRKLLRDALRLTLWRAIGSTGAWLVPQVFDRKRAACGL